MSLLKNTLYGIKPSFKKDKARSKTRLDSLVKPLGSLGKLEEIAVKLSGITGLVSNPMGKKCVIIMSSDNGVLDEGISTCPQSVTATQTINFLKGIAGIGVLARHAVSDLHIIDIGINADIYYPNLVNKKIRKGTWNIAEGPAMKREEAIKSIEVGIETVSKLVKEGYQIFGTGEMGIGNTSTSSAMVMAFINCDADDVVGKGSGLTDEGLKFKKDIINKALCINKPDQNDPLDVLAKVGGFDIGGMAGCFLGAAYHRKPIVIDGFISATAALLAYKMNPLVIDYMFPSHLSSEPGHAIVMKELNFDPFLNLNMRLGEGTGTVLAFNIIDAANAIITEMATFDEASINDDFLIDIR